MRHQYIYPLDERIASIKDDVAYDEDGNIVEYDKAAAQALCDADQYKAKRSAEYPSIVDQLDTLYHEGYDGWKSQIQAVKERFPK